MKPGVYADAEDTKLAEAEFWREHGYTFGAWGFLPSTGEVRRNGGRVTQFSPVLAATLEELIKAHPRYISGGASTDLRQSVKRIRAVLGQNAILTVHAWGYRFNPEAMLVDG